MPVPGERDRGGDRASQVADRQAQARAVRRQCRTHVRRLLEQMELQLEDLEADAGEDDLVAEARCQRRRRVFATAFERKQPSRKSFPEHLPRERVVVPAPCSCPACGSRRLSSKLGEDVTETLEVSPASMEGHPDRAREVLVPGLREDHAAAGPVPCRAAWLGRPQLSSAMLLFEKYGRRRAPQPSGRALRPRGRAAAARLERWPIRSGPPPLR